MNLPPSAPFCLIGFLAATLDFTNPEIIGLYMLHMKTASELNCFVIIEANMGFEPS